MNKEIVYPTLMDKDVILPSYTEWLGDERLLIIAGDLTIVVNRDGSGARPLLK
jgi:hypothetical protein